VLTLVTVVMLLTLLTKGLARTRVYAWAPGPVKGPAVKVAAGRAIR
jgi:hypothetical protein